MKYYILGFRAARRPEYMEFTSKRERQKKIEKLKKQFGSAISIATATMNL